MGHHGSETKTYKIDRKPDEVKDSFDGKGDDPRDRRWNRSISPEPKRRRGLSHSPSPQRERPRNYRRHSHRSSSLSRSPDRRRRRHDDDDRRERKRGPRRSRSPQRQSRHLHRARSPRSRSPAPTKRSAAPLPSQQDAFQKSDGVVVRKSPEPEKQKPNYAPSGLLAAETNTVANTDIVLKYNEPPESRLPPASQPWRLYVFKSSELLETLNLHERTCWLFGREKMVVDHLTEHPSCSKQHAVLQFRYTEKKDEWGERKGRVRLYVIDLESANGTSLNGEKLPGKRFVEVKSGDMLQFGESTREYVALLPPKDKGKNDGAG